MKYADNLVVIEVFEGSKSKEILYSANYACPTCGFSFPELSPRNVFNLTILKELVHLVQE